MAFMVPSRKVLSVLAIFVGFFMFPVSASFQLPLTTCKENTVKEEMLILALGFSDFSPWYFTLLFLGLW